jgi:SAM-dependent methyltransferase
MTLRFDTEVLACPRCGSGLSVEEEGVRCRGQGHTYPVVNGIPILIDEDASVFRFEDFSAGRPTTWPSTPGHRRFVSRLLPSLSMTLGASHRLRRMIDILASETERPRVLVVGGCVLGAGMEVVATDTRVELIETDVTFGPRTQLVCDAHALPFADGSVDAVVVQNVLDAVPNPYRCVEEIHRVLRAGGIAYAETPFMQQVCGRRFDFTRFTYLGHRRLFRRFATIEDGIAGGPGMALAWSVQYFLLSFPRSTHTKAATRAFSRLTLSWLKRLDPYLSRRPGAFDAAAAFYFVGRKHDTALTDREILDLYVE